MTLFFLGIPQQPFVQAECWPLHLHHRGGLQVHPLLSRLCSGQEPAAQEATAAAAAHAAAAVPVPAHPCQERADTEKVSRAQQEEVRAAATKVRSFLFQKYGSVN